MHPYRIMLSRFAKVCALLALPAATALFFSLRHTAQPAEAQNLPGQSNVCPEFITQVLGTLEQNCTGIGRNTACYGNVQVNATFSEPVPPEYFSQPADTADLVILQSISTTQLDLLDDTWGVALMSMQANLPGTLPGQAVNFLLFGDATVVNAVTPDTALLPVDPVEVTTAADTLLYTLPADNANTIENIPAGSPLEADAISEDGAWVRVVYQPAQPPALGGWIAISALALADLSGLPVVDDETRTPMQAFLFRTGLGAPICAQAPNQVVIQGPTNTQVSLNVNGADIIVGSTVTMTSVSGAPQEIIDTLDLPPEIQEQLNAPDDPNTDQDKSDCAVMQLSVVSGEVTVNEGDVALPAGNKAFSVYCGVPPPSDPDNPEATPDPNQFVDFGSVEYASRWGAFGPMDEEEIEQLEILEQLNTNILNYEITLPDPNNIQPPYNPNQPEATPEVTPFSFGGFATSTPTSSPTPTAEPTVQPTAPPPDAGQPAYVQASQGSGQSAVVGQPFATPFRARLLDPYSSPVGGVPITFTAPASGASGTFAATGTHTETVITDGDGYATASAFTGNTISGSYTVTASAPAGAAAASRPFAKRGVSEAPLMQTVLGTFSVSNNPDAPANIIAFAGSGQSSTFNTPFDNPLQAQVIDQFGNGISGVTVTFTAPGSGASARFSGSASANAVTNSGGVAVSPVPDANDQIGAYSVTAAYSSFTTNFTLTNAPPIIQIAAGSPQSTVVNDAFATNLSVRAIDDSGNGIGGLNVTFTAPGGGATAYFGEMQTANATTDGSGFATAPTLYANSIAGSYNVTATSIFGITAVFNLTNMPGDAAAMNILSGTLQSAAVTTAFPDSLRVRVVDLFNNPIPGASVTFTAPASGASGTFNATGTRNQTVTTDSAGEATSSAFTANTTAGNYFIVASSGSASTNFTLTNMAGAPAAMTATGGTPQSITVGGSFAAPLQARVTDAYGNGVPGVNVTFTAPGSGASGTFAATSTNIQAVVTDAAGFATTSVFTANTTPGVYTVTAQAGALNTNFSLTNLTGPPSQLFISGGDSQTAIVNTAYAQQLQARVLDVYDNPISGVNVTFTMPGGGARAAFPGNVFTAIAATNASGYALAPPMTANTVAGSFTVNVTAGALHAPADLTNLPGTPANLSATAGTPQSAAVTATFGAALQARLTDGFGNGVGGQSVTFTAPGSGASGTFAATSTNIQVVVTDAAGFATASAFTANTAAGGYTVTASYSSFTVNYSLANNPGAAAVINIVGGNGQSATVNTAFAAPLTGNVRDAYGNPIPGASVSFTAPGSGASATFASSGTNTENVTADGGGAFASSTLTAVTAGGGYNVTAASGSAIANYSLTNNAPPTVVTNLNDSGPGSLREIVTNALPGSTITFSVTGTITLSSAIGIAQNLTIDGPGASSLVISGGGVDRVFVIGGNVLIQNVRITNGTGNGFDGGLLYVSDPGALTLNFVQLDNGVSLGLPCCEKGGAIFSEGALIITNSGLYNNTAGQGGTAIMVWVNGDGFSITDSCIVGNFGAAFYDIRSLIGGTAENNWWGDPGGPGVGSADSTTLAVTTFRTTPIAGVPGC